MHYSTSFALYRLPCEKQCFMVRQNDPEPMQLRAMTDLEGKSGFVLAPFELSEDCPLLVVRADSVTEVNLDDIELPQPQELNHSDIDAEQQQYYNDFHSFHENLLNGHFAKIVLSRRSIESTEMACDPCGLFKRACMMYPRQFVALVSTPVSGTWLMATPEILLEQGDTPGTWHTMALAGTKPVSDTTPWDEKNVAEQALVARYIRSCIGRHATSMSEQGPRTAQAGRLQHLRTDFTFSLSSDAVVPQIIEELHPTPAVCGLPKQEAHDFILSHESAPRDYYSGFAGLLNCQGMTRLFVTLRCMKIDGRHFHLYAGGGLLAGSTAQSEWHETEIKMDTMRQCIATKQA